MSSMWAQYQKELWDYETIEVSAGFVCYRHGTDHTFVAECYVHPDFRLEGLASRLVKQVETIAKKAGKLRLVSRVDMEQGGAAKSLQAQLAYGFVPYLARDNKLWLKKELT